MIYALQLLSLAIFLFTLLLIVSESVHRTYAALIGAGLFLLLGVVDPESLLEFMELEILCIVFGMMLIVKGAEKSGIFSYIAARMMELSSSSRLLAVLLTFTMILTIFLNNIGAMLISATITLLIARGGELRPQTILIFQAIVSNLGSMVLMVSSIPNIIVAMEGGLSFNTFLSNMTPIALLLYIATLTFYLKVLEEERLEKRELRPLTISKAVKGRGYLIPIIILWLSAFASAFIDNIPLTATFTPIARYLILEGGLKAIWWGLIIGANLGGNILPIGSPSSIIAVGVAEQEGTPISLKRFSKVGLTITLIHLLFSTLYLLIRALY